MRSDEQRGDFRSGGCGPRVTVLCIHPAPYRDPALSALAASGEFDLSVLVLSEDHLHREWQWNAPPLPRLVLSDRKRGSRALQIMSLIRALASLRPRVLVVPGYSEPGSLAALAYAFITRTPYIASVDSTTANGRLPRRSWLRHALVARVIHNAAAHWCAGAATREYLRAWNVPDTAIFEGAYCFDTATLAERLRETGGRVQARAHLQLRPDEFVILSVGRMLPFRRFGLLVEAFAALPERAVLVLVGDGPDHEAILRAVPPACASRIRFAGPVPFGSLATHFAAADVYVHAGAEPYSTATEFAAIAGLPIVASKDVGYVHDLISRGVTPLLFTPGDRRELQDRLLFACEESNKIRALGESIARVARTRHAAWSAEQLSAAIWKALRKDPRC